MSTKVYNADEVTISISGVLIDAGFGDGEFLRIEQDSDDFLDVVGTNGEVAVSKSNDRRATATLTLMQTSDANDLLSALSNLARNSPGLAGAGAFYVRDRQGRSIYEADSCWVAKAPDPGFDRSATSREWKIRIGSLRRVDGGNSMV